MKTLKEIKTELEKKLPPALVGRLFEHYTEIKNNYFLGKYEPSELNAGKFVEVVYRIIESQLNADGSFSALGTHVVDIVGKLRGFENTPRTAGTEPLRRHIPRVLITITEIRNNRGVGHTPGTINPNYLDSTFVVAAADWVVADIIREFCGFPIEEAQRVIDSLITRKTPLIFELNGIRRILKPEMECKNKVLILLMEFEGEWVSLTDLLAWTEYKNITNFKVILKQMHGKKYIEYDEPNNRVLIFPPGVQQAEKILSKYSREAQ
ncbi:MAG: hypothetical protein V3W11_10440 [bacterium]